MDKSMDKVISKYTKNSELEIRILIKDKYFYYFLVNSKDFDKEDVTEIHYEYLFPKVENKNQPFDRKVVQIGNKYYLKNKKVVLRHSIDDITIAIDLESISNTTQSKTQGFENIRYKERVSKYSNKYPNWRFDFTKSIIQKTRNKLENKIKKEEFDYQLEVEYIGKDKPKKTDFEVIINWFNNLKLLYQLQKHLDFRGKYSIIQITNNPVPLTLGNINKIQQNYVVSEKADGERCLLFYNHQFTVYRILKPFVLEEIGKSQYKNCLLDAEFLGKSYLIFDCLIDDNHIITDKHFKERYQKLDKFIDKKLNITKKEFLGFDQKTSIFELSKQKYTNKYPYGIDGLIYNPINQKYYDGIIYKWKPVSDLTNDFLIRDIKIEKGYKYVYLFVNISKKLFQQKQFKFDDQYKKYFPFITVDFNSVPFYFKTSPIAKIPVKEIKKNGQKILVYGKNKIPIIDNTIVEFSYDINQKDEELRWIPYRVRIDKTKDYLANINQGRYSGERGPNGWNTAMSNLESIKNPITKKMIFGEEPIPEQYYAKKETENEINLYRFNNFVKTSLYRKYLKKGDKLLELAGGRGGDLFKIQKQNIDYLLLTNINKEALKEAENRAAKLNQKMTINFLQLDLLQKDIIKKVEDVIKKRKIDQFDVISCQFAFHYFMKNQQTIDNIKSLIDKFLKKGGIFMFTGFDGLKVFNELKTSTKAIFDFAEIEKLYSEKTFQNFGQEIDVYVEKIGIKHSEYLINFDYIKKVFDNYKVIEDTNFGQKLSEFRSFLSAEEKKYIGLHRYLVLQKI